MTTQIIYGSTWSDEKGAALRRGVDIVCAVIALGILWPLMLGIAGAIWLETGRPILFVQSRIGRKGTIFKIFKFRKFGSRNQREGRPLTVEGDERATRVGRFLLATKLDEIPQFINVLFGDMSIVGPRPESLYFAECFSDGFEEILKYKPGIFGPCQAIFRHECRLFPQGDDPVEYYKRVLFPAKIRIDLSYYRRRTVFSDIRWIGISILSICGLMRKDDIVRSLLRHCRGDLICKANEAAHDV